MQVTAGLGRHTVLAVAAESYRTTCLQSLEDELMAQTNLGSTSPCLLMSRPLSYSGSSTPCEPSWFQSYKFFFLSSWANLLLVFVPVSFFTIRNYMLLSRLTSFQLSFISHLFNWDAALRFSLSFIAIMSLAKVF